MTGGCYSEYVNESSDRFQMWSRILKWSLSNSFMGTEFKGLLCGINTGSDQFHIFSVKPPLKKRAISCSWIESAPPTILSTYIHEWVTSEASGKFGPSTMTNFLITRIAKKALGLMSHVTVFNSYSCSASEGVFLRKTCCFFLRDLPIFVGIFTRSAQSGTT